MPEMSRRLQILVDQERWSRLERHAKQRGASVATLVREAIDVAFPKEEPAPGAAKNFLSRQARDLGNWQAAKEEIEQGLERESGDNLPD